MAPDSKHSLDKSLLQAAELAVVENEIQVKGMNVESQPIDCVSKMQNKIM